MANFYDVLIDCPTAENQLGKLLKKWEKASIVVPELKEKCAKHVEGLKKKLQEEYKK